jgi:ABC-type sugar transport system ATPase subunit
MIEVQNLSVHAGAFQLHQVSFQVAAGSYAVLMGKTGSGKTTLLETICGLRPSESGKVLI